MAKVQFYSEEDLVFIEKSKSKRFVDITGVKFGRLTPLGISGHRKNYPSQYCWFCKCDCGNIISVGRGDLVSKNTSSCGCLASESKKSVNTIHGHDRKGIVEKTYKIWTSLKYFEYVPRPQPKSSSG